MTAMARSRRADQRWSTYHEPKSLHCGLALSLFGLLYSFYGLAILPVPRSVLVPWGNGVYGATLMGFSVTLFFAGRHAFRKNDTDLMRALLYSVFAWLVIEALQSE